MAPVHQWIKYGTKSSKDRLYLTGLGLKLLLRRPVSNLCISPALKGHLDEKEHQTAFFMWEDKKKQKKTRLCVLQYTSPNAFFPKFILISTKLSDPSYPVTPVTYPSAKICKERGGGGREKYGVRHDDETTREKEPNVFVFFF